MFLNYLYFEGVNAACEYFDGFFDVMALVGIADETGFVG